MTPPPEQHAYIIRRQTSGGGAELAAKRLVEHLSADWAVHPLAAGLRLQGSVIPGAMGPGWWRSLRFARGVDALLRGRPGVILNLERGPDCHVYRAGDGVHLRWRRLRFGSSPAWMLNPLHWLYPRLEAKTVHSARFVVANSQMVRHEMEQQYPGSAHKLRVVPNGFDPVFFSPAPDASPQVRKEMNLTEGQKLFLFVGKGWERKGLERALELVAEYNRAVGEDGDRGVFVVVGKGKPQAYLSRIRRLNLEENVRFLGPRTDIRKFYQAADFMILPTLYDPFSNACLEALACGCPVITTKSNGVSQFIKHCRTGFVLTDDLAGDLAEASAWMRTADINRREVAESVAVLTVEQEMRAFSALMQECLS